MNIDYEYEEVKCPIKRIIATGWWTTSVGDKDINTFAQEVLTGRARFSACHDSDQFVDKHSVAYKITVTVEKLK